MPYAAPLMLALLAAAPIAAADPPTFLEATGAVGLGGGIMNAARLCLADVNSDGRPDVVLRVREAGKPDVYRIFLNTPNPAALHGFHFIELDRPTGLPTPRDGDSLVFADLDNDGHADALFTRYLDVNNEAFTEPEDEPKRTAWLKGNGDGTFGEPRVIEAAQRATTVAIAVADMNRDGLLDLYLGHWYSAYGRSNDAFENDLLLQRRVGGAGDPRPEFVRHEIRTLDNDNVIDPDGRPTYGALALSLSGHQVPDILELNYGRRANRLWMPAQVRVDPLDLLTTPEELRDLNLRWAGDLTPPGLDGDDIRHGRYPDWLKEVAKRDPRFGREDEKPYRVHGNTFDAAVGDIDNDGDLDLFLAEITHAWAGDSSDRSRFLVNQRSETGELRFLSPPELSVDRIPPVPPREAWPEGYLPRWNQGDLFCELADLDHDGRLDLILSSGDYPDPPPFDQRLRIFHQQDDGTFRDITLASGIDHPGSQQISLGDVDADGDLDILVGQSFNRFTREMIDARTPPGPTARLYLNQTADKRAAAGSPSNSITLKLIGDPTRGITRDALGAIVELTTEADGKEFKQLRPLIGIGGHAGKQHEFLVHFGLGEATKAKRIEVRWPDSARTTTVLENVPAGHHVVRAGASQPAAAGNSGQ